MNAPDRYERFVVPEGVSKVSYERCRTRGTRKSSMRRRLPSSVRIPSATLSACNCTGMRMYSLLDTSCHTLFSKKSF